MPRKPNPETLLTRALRAMAQLERAKETLAECERQGLTLFNRDGPAEAEILKSTGKIVYKRSTKWSADPETIPAARTTLALDFDQVFEAEVHRHVPESVIDELAHLLGGRSSDFIAEQVAWRIRRPFQNLAKKEPDNALVQRAQGFFLTGVSERVSFKGVE